MSDARYLLARGRLQAASAELYRRDGLHQAARRHRARLQCVLNRYAAHAGELAGDGLRPVAERLWALANRRWFTANSRCIELAADVERARMECQQAMDEWQRACAERYAYENA